MNNHSLPFLLPQLSPDPTYPSSSSISSLAQYKTSNPIPHQHQQQQQQQQQQHHHHQKQQYPSLLPLPISSSSHHNNPSLRFRDRSKSLGSAPATTYSSSGITTTIQLPPISSILNYTPGNNNYNYGGPTAPAPNYHANSPMSISSASSIDTTAITTTEGYNYYTNEPLSRTRSFTSSYPSPDPGNRRRSTTEDIPIIDAPCSPSSINTHIIHHGGTSKKRRQRSGPSCDSCRVRKVKCDAEIIILKEFDHCSAKYPKSTYHPSSIEVLNDFHPKDYGLSNDQLQAIYQEYYQSYNSGKNNSQSPKIVKKEVSIHRFVKTPTKLIRFRPCSACNLRDGQCHFSKGFTRADISKSFKKR
ncbi:Sut2 protein [Saccharomycopsis crataegensis]|uniref:Sut2 protein n=1 Tax=Saccharomycopsis crataegensis TaxID=43959 RepID=A0AAV5QT43_9ASCO|nr:Sut2 protein [Saccharomycopsis crataegensis]